jgi:hypothetical protein
MPSLRKVLLRLLFFALLPTASDLAHAAETVVPKEVAALTGTFTGSWTIFGLDDRGQSVKRAAWTDTIKSQAPTIQGDRAFVSTTDEMTFEGGKVPPRKVEGREGYFLNPDGTLGDYFIESFGQVQRARKLGSNVWAYSMPADARELSQFGLTNVASAQHVIVKVIIFESGVETHRISRVTTVNWKDAEGKERSTQFLSLQGFHRRKSP